MASVLPGNHVMPCCCVDLDGRCGERAESTGDDWNVRSALRAGVCFPREGLPIALRNLNGS